MKTFDYVVVAPCFENNEHHSGLDQNTRLRLIAAAYMLKTGKAETIIVGGGKLRKMKESFAELMKKYLVEHGINPGSIGTEEYTFDTASQISWVAKNINTMDNITCFITDSAQAYHIGALIKGFGIEECEVLSSEKITETISYNYHYDHYVKNVHKSFDWKIFQLRESLLFLFTMFVDPKNKSLGKISIKRRT